MAEKREPKEISWTEFGDLSEKLSEKVRSAGINFELVVGIARGGIPIAMCISDALGVKIDIINVKSYEGRKRGEPKILSTLTESVREKSILLVDDLVDEGDTMIAMIGHLQRDAPGSISTAVLFKKPWSKFEPDFFLESADRWVVFPWEKGEHSRTKNE